MPFSKNPIYNLKAVLKDTGLKPDVLRAWERRYGLPAPERTQGGHRLYSDHDVALLKWLIARQQEGLSISHAVEMWRDQLAEGKDPLAEAAPKVTTLNLLQQSIYYPPETSLDSIRSHWLAACLNYNEIAAEQTLNQAFGMYPIETVCIEVLQRGMSEVGTLWYEGRASVQQEHFASALVMRRLDALLSASPAPTRAQTVLVGCPSDEWHTFTPLLIALFLRRRGLNVIYLGANVPANRFEETLAAVQPHLVVLAAQQLISAASLQQTALHLAARGVTIAFGGRIFTLQPDIRRNIAGHFLGDRLDAAIENIERLLESHPDAPQPVFPSNEYLETLKMFLVKRPLIDSLLNEHTPQIPGSSLEYMEIANRFMGNNIIAALQLGDMGYLNAEIDWLTVMLKSHQLPAQMVSRYLETYASAVQQQLNGQGHLIVEWLETKNKDFS
jgi:MerR family transcriptional regulator, light-induced transcriptional regulator